MRERLSLVPLMWCPPMPSLWAARLMEDGMRVLFVDDEQRILSGIRNALIFAPGEWDADYALSAEESFEKMAGEPYDVIVTDMKMPGLTGADVLEHVKAVQPESIRIVLSGEIDPRLAERALPLAHKLIAKPCDPDRLVETIHTVYERRSAFPAGPLRDVLGGLDDLPTQPALFTEIQAAVREGEGAAVVARLIESDLTAAASVVKLANSAFFGFDTPTRTIREAVVRLGSATVAGIVLNTEIAQLAPPEVAEMVEAVSEHGVQAAAELHRELGREIEQAALAGLVHDIGALVLITQFPDVYRSIDAPVDETEEIERQAFGVSHTEVGAHVLEMWNIDPVIVETVRHHHDPSEATGDARRIIDVLSAFEAEQATLPASTGADSASRA